MNIIDVMGILIIFGIIGYIGYASSKDIKDMDDFTLAGSQLGKIQAGFSMAATEFGGSSLIGAMALCYSIGLSGAWWDWAAVLPLILLGLFFAGKIRLPNMVTITDYFEYRYDKRIKLIASVMHLLATTTQLSTQFLVGATALNGIIGTPIYIGLILSVIFVLLYTMGGGLMAVVNTDVIQFVIIVISILLIIPICLYHVGGIEGLKNSVPPTFLSFNQLGSATILSWMLFSFFSYATSQHYVQRVFASKDKKTAQFSFIFTGASYFVYGFLISIIGISIYVLIPGLEDPNMGYALLIKNFVPLGLRGLILGGIFAAAMSTADSMLLAASTLFVNDIYEPYISKGIENKEENKLKTIRRITVIISVISVFISLFMKSIVDIMYLGGLFYSTSVFFPLILGLYWKKSNSKAALYSIICSVTVGLISELFLAGKINGFFGMPSNIMATLVSIVVFITVANITYKKGTI